MRWYTAMHDRANILISPSSLGRLLVLAYLHWRVANATNLNRVGNIGLHTRAGSQRAFYAIEIKQKFSVWFCWYCFFHYLYYLSIVASLCCLSCLSPFFIVVCILFIFVYRPALFISVIRHFLRVCYMLPSIAIYSSLRYLSFLNYYLSLFDITFHHLFLRLSVFNFIFFFSLSLFLSFLLLLFILFTTILYHLIIYF